MSPHYNFVPEHLRIYLSDQDMNLYSAIDHASWRFILKISKAFFKKAAHQKYLDGLVETGIDSERIPAIVDIDRCLQKFGWRAVPVDGFIPPLAFMEFQSLGILPIACEMRTLEHLAYTPAPDIVHEAAGHAPILADPEFSAFLKSYGQIAWKSIHSKQDHAVYEAIRELSEIKEDPQSTPEQIHQAEKNLEHALAENSTATESSHLGRMNWWSAEYGLVGDLKNPKIYGAGLLSSVSESYNCLSDSVLKVPFTLDCIHTRQDITKPQPQLFVTPSFPHLTHVLQEYSETMAYKKGGISGLSKALQSQALCTVVLDTGIQISGVLQEFSPDYLKFSGPTALAYEDRQLENQGPNYHQQGFSTILGNPQLPKKLEELPSVLRFDSGVEIHGKPDHWIEKNEKVILIRFHDCTIVRKHAHKEDDILYRSEWGPFDLAVGSAVVSVFGGAADRASYQNAIPSKFSQKKAQKTNLTREQQPLNELYRKVRNFREKGSFSDTETLSFVREIRSHLDRFFENDWLLRYELIELLDPSNQAESRDEKNELIAKITQSSKYTPEIESVIQRGLQNV